MVALSQPLLDSGRLGVIVLDPDFTSHRLSRQARRLADAGGSGDGGDPGPGRSGRDLEGDRDRRPNLIISLPRISWRTGNPADDRVFSLEIVPGDEPGLLHLVLRDETDIATLEREIIQKRNELSLAYDAARTGEGSR